MAPRALREISTKQATPAPNVYDAFMSQSTSTARLPAPAVGPYLVRSIRRLAPTTFVLVAGRCPGEPERLPPPEPETRTRQFYFAMWFCKLGAESTTIQ